MSYYVRYVFMDDASVTLPELETALKAINPGYEIDGEYVVLDDEEYGKIEINGCDDPFLTSDLSLLRELAAKKSNKDTLLADLDRVTSLVIVQAIWSKERGEVLTILEPLFDWLLAHRKGFLVVEGGSFYDIRGQIL